MCAFVTRELQFDAREDGRVSDFGSRSRDDQKKEEEKKKGKALTRPAADLSH